jgi:hypothetical protein
MEVNLTSGRSGVQNFWFFPGSTSDSFQERKGALFRRLVMADSAEFYMETTTNRHDRFYLQCSFKQPSVTEMFKIFIIFAIVFIDKVFHVKR